MTNYERIINMSKDELAEELRLIANWSKNEVSKANDIPNFFKDYLDKEVDSISFNIGDTVEVLFLLEHTEDVKKGDMGVVVDIDYDDEYSIRVDINGISDLGFKREELKIVKE